MRNIALVCEEVRSEVAQYSKQPSSLAITCHPEPRILSGFSASHQDLRLTHPRSFKLRSSAQRVRSTGIVDISFPRTYFVNLNRTFLDSQSVATLDWHHRLRFFLDINTPRHCWSFLLIKKSPPRKSTLALKHTFQSNGYRRLVSEAKGGSNSQHGRNDHNDIHDHLRYSLVSIWRCRKSRRHVQATTAQSRCSASRRRSVGNLFL